MSGWFSKKSAEEIRDEKARVDIERGKRDIQSSNWNRVKGVGRTVSYPFRRAFGGEKPQPIIIKQSGPKTITEKKRFPWLKTIIIVLLLIFLISGFLSGWLPTKLKQGVTNLKQSEFGIAVYGFFSKVFGMIVYPEESFGSWQNPDAKKEGDITARISIDKIEPAGAYFFEGEKIVVDAIIKINNMEVEGDKLKLVVNCELEDFNGKVEYKPIGVNEENKGQIFYPNSAGKVNDFLSVSCTFPGGINNIDNEIEGKTVSVNVTYEGIAKSDLAVYTIDTKEIAKSGGREEYAEKYIKPLVLSSGLWAGNGVITTRKLDSGPMTIAIGTNTQPFSKESNQAKLFVRFKSDDEGSIKEINSFRMIFPKNMEPDNKGSANDCGCLSKEDNSLIKEVRDQIAKGEERWKFDDCIINGDARDMTFGCWVNIKEDSASLEKNYIKAIANYKYGYEQSKTIEVRKKNV
ncbi:MAG: hypothetical protein PHG05_01960 [Candidatus Nanoarchaeia archaeon]|nr:hypothetical protein [Candidatus Nanoarchaeia archaeon]